MTGVRCFLPNHPPQGFEEVPPPPTVPHGVAYVSRFFKVLVSIDVDDEGASWLHLSISHRERKPTVFECAKFKKLFLGERGMTLEPSIGVNPHVAHWWAPLAEVAS